MALFSSFSKQQAAANADILSNKLLDDLLEDTAQELWKIERHEKVQAQAIAMLDSPSLETMLQRMEEIEVSNLLVSVDTVSLSMPEDVSLNFHLKRSLGMSVFSVVDFKGAEILPSAEIGLQQELALIPSASKLK